jgi:predicted Co/Zn/Cd cation transporter (cation efflux family)
MKIFDNPNVDTGFKILGAVLIFLGLRKVFSQSDGKKGFSHFDFKTLFAFGLFVWAFIYVMVKEGNRTHEYSLYSDTLMAFIITGLFSVLHMERIITIFKDILQLLIQLKFKTQEKETITSKIEATVKTTTETPTKEEAG